MPTYSELNKDAFLWMWRTMTTIRRFEEQSRREADAGKLRGMHSSICKPIKGEGIRWLLFIPDFRWRADRNRVDSRFRGSGGMGEIWTG